MMQYSIFNNQSKLEKLKTFASLASIHLWIIPINVITKCEHT